MKKTLLLCLLFLIIVSVLPGCAAEVEYDVYLLNTHFCWTNPVEGVLYYSFYAEETDTDTPPPETATVIDHSTERTAYYRDTVAIPYRWEKIHTYVLDGYRYEIDGAGNLLNYTLYTEIRSGATVSEEEAVAAAKTYLATIADASLYQVTEVRRSEEHEYFYIDFCKHLSSYETIDTVTLTVTKYGEVKEVSGRYFNIVPDDTDVSCFDPEVAKEQALACVKKACENSEETYDVTYGEVSPFTVFILKDGRTGYRCEIEVSAAEKDNPQQRYDVTAQILLAAK